MYGGTARAVPRPGGGFEVNMPACRSRPTAPQTAGPRQRHALVAGGGMTIRVLLVDDQDLVRAGFAMVLGSQSDLHRRRPRRPTGGPRSGWHARSRPT